MFKLEKVNSGLTSLAENNYIAQPADVKFLLQETRDNIFLLN